AKGKGLSGGLFAFPAGEAPSNSYTYLDHCQINTANAGVRYHHNALWWALQGNYGSGLRTGPDNSRSLPAHLTGDTTVGYEFAHAFKLSADVLNLSDQRYPISIANGFNG